MDPNAEEDAYQRDDRCQTKTTAACFPGDNSDSKHGNFAYGMPLVAVPTLPMLIRPTLQNKTQNFATRAAYLSFPTTTFSPPNHHHYHHHYHHHDTASSPTCSAPIWVLANSSCTSYQKSRYCVPIPHFHSLPFASTLLLVRKNACASSWLATPDRLT
jgi:hypothetical protein